MSGRINLAELAARSIHPDDWVWITPAERDALVAAVQGADAHMNRPEWGTIGDDIKCDLALRASLARFDFGDAA